METASLQGMKLLCIKAEPLEDVYDAVACLLFEEIERLYGYVQEKLPLKDELEPYQIEDLEDEQRILTALIEVWKYYTPPQDWSNADKYVV